jgi:hypothetical protein
MANTNLWGFTSLRHLSGSRISTVGTARVFDAVRTAAAEYNRVSAAILAEWVEAVTVAQQSVDLPGTGEMQPLDVEGDGNPKPVRISGAYTVGYPIQGAGTAFGDNRVVRALMTVDEVAKNVEEVQRKDASWIIRHILAAIFTNTAWTFTDLIGADGGAGAGAVTVRPLAIAGDGITYPVKGGSAATDTHYLAQAAAIADASNPYPLIWSELIEHPSNGNAGVTAYISTSLVATTRALATFTSAAEAGVQYGANTDLAMGGMFDNVGPGDRFLGYADNVRIVEWSWLPAGYIVAKADGIPVVGMREYPAAGLQGLFPELDNIDGNHLKYSWIRYAGFGVRNRVAAVVYRIGNAAYAIPTGYSAPLAV